MSKKPSFANLGSRLAQKSSEGSAAVSTGDVPPTKKTHAAVTIPIETDTSARRSRQPDGRRGILVRARPEAWKALKQIALDGERTLQDVMTEAINDVLAKNDKSPLA